jgi:hypothetical protein
MPYAEEKEADRQELIERGMVEPGVAEVMRLLKALSATQAAYADFNASWNGLASNAASSSGLPAA